MYDEEGNLLTDTTTDANGMYEFVSPVIATILMVAVKGGTNVITGEEFEGEMEINSQIGFNVNPASEMASDLIAEGLSVEEAKDKVVEFANGFDNVEGITKDDLFTKSIGEDLLQNNHKKAIEKSVLFNSLNNIKRMLIETVSNDADSVEDKKVNEVVRKSMATFIRNNGSGAANAIDNMVSETLDSIEKGGEISLTKVNDLAKRATIAKTIDSQIARFKAISTEGSAYEKIADVEIERIKIKSEAEVIETIVKVEIDPSLVKDERNDFILKVKEDKEAEVNESKKDFFAEKEAEKEAMKLKAQKMRRRSQIDKEFYHDKKGELKTLEEGVDTLDSEDLRVIDSLEKALYSIDAEIKEWYSEVEMENEEEDLGYDMKKFDMIIRHSNMIMDKLSKIKESAEPGEEPGEKPKEPVGKLVNFNDLQKSIEDVKSFCNQHFLLDIQTPTSTEDLDQFIKDTEAKATKGLVALKESVEKGDVYSNISEAYFFQRVLEVMREEVLNPMRDEGASEEDQQIVEANHAIMNALYDFIDLHGRAYVFNSSIPSVHAKLNRLSSEGQNFSQYIQQEKDQLTGQLSNGGITQLWRFRSMIQYITRKAIYDLIFDPIKTAFMGDPNLVLNKVNSDAHYKLGFSDITVSSFDVTKGLVTLSVKGSLSDLQNNNHNYDNFVYIAEKDQCVSISEEGGKSTFVISVGSELSTNAYDLRCHLPGVVIQSSDTNSDFQNATRTMGRLAFVGSDCNGELTLENWIVRSNSCCYQPSWNILHKSYTEYSPKLMLRSYIDGAQEASTIIWDNVFRGKSYSTIEEWRKDNPNYSFGTGNGYYMSENNSIDNHNPHYYGDGKYADICGDYELADGNRGFYKTMTNTGPNRDELSNPLYIKYDIGVTNTTKIYELVDGEYVPFTGWVYTKNVNTQYSTADMLRQSTNVNTYFTINGCYENHVSGMFGIQPGTRGFSDCDGNERNTVLMMQSNYMRGGYSLDKRFIGTTVVWKSVDGVELGKETFNESNLMNPFTNSVGSLLQANSTYFVEATIGEKGELIFQITTKLYSWGLGRFGQPDNTGRFTYQFIECVDTDGDGYYDQIDFDPNDPNIFGDYDLDGIADHLDDFPFDHGTVYSICKDAESGENVAINANFSKLDEFIHIVYGEEKGGAPQIHGYEFIETINEEPVAGTTKVLLDPSSNMRINEFHPEGDETLLSRVLAYRGKYNEKGGKGKE